MLISVALGCFGSGYDLIFVAACWVLWSWLHVGFFGNWIKVKNVIFAPFFIIFASYSATDLMFGVLICLHVDFCGTWILRLWLWSNLCRCMLGSLVLAACWVLWQLDQGKKCHLCLLFYHVCVLLCNRSNVWCSYMLACSFLWHLDTLALAMI